MRKYKENQRLGIGLDIRLEQNIKTRRRRLIMQHFLQNRVVILFLFNQYYYLVDSFSKIHFLLLFTSIPIQPMK